MTAMLKSKKTWTTATASLAVVLVALLSGIGWVSTPHGIRAAGETDELESARQVLLGKVAEFNLERSRYVEVQKMAQTEFICGITIDTDAEQHTFCLAMLGVPDNVSTDDKDAASSWCASIKSCETYAEPRHNLQIITDAHARVLWCDRCIDRLRGINVNDAGTDELSWAIGVETHPPIEELHTTFRAELADLASGAALAASSIDLDKYDFVERYYFNVCNCNWWFD